MVRTTDRTQIHRPLAFVAALAPLKPSPAVPELPIAVMGPFATILTKCFGKVPHEILQACSKQLGQFSRVAALVALTFTPCTTRAADYGSFGALFPVEEPSVLETIYARLGEMEANGELAEMEQEMQDTVRARVNRPAPVYGIARTQTYRAYEVDLSIELDRDLADHRGVVFARAGTRINPLDHSRFNKRLIFIDGDDPDQVSFAVELAASEPSKIILVNGSPLDLTEEHQVLFYFDQGGHISDRFRLTLVPAVVSRKDPVMLVEEIPVPTRKAEK